MTATALSSSSPTMNFKELNSSDNMVLEVMKTCAFSPPSSPISLRKDNIYKKSNGNGVFIIPKRSSQPRPLKPTTPLRSQNAKRWNSKKILSQYVQRGDMKAAQTLFQSLIKQQQPLNIPVYHTMIQGYVQKRQTQKAEGVLKLLMKAQTNTSFFPISLYRTILRGYKNEKRGDDAYRILQTIRKRGTMPVTERDYNLVLASYRNKNYDKAREIFLIMTEKDHISPSLVTYTTMLQYASTTEQIHEIWNKMMASGYKPNVVAYNALLQRYASLGELTRIESIISKDMKRDGIRPDAMTYSIWMNVYADQPSQYPQTFQIFSSADHATTVLYNGLIKAACHGKNITQAETVLRSMEADTRIRPDNYTFSTIISAYAKIGDIHSAMRIFEKAKISHCVNAHTLNALLQGYANTYRPMEAESFLQELEQQNTTSGLLDVTSYNTIMNAWAKSRYTQKLQKVYSLFQIISSSQEGNIRPDIISYNIVLNACATSSPSHQALQFCMDTYTKLHHTPYIKPDSITYGTMLKAIGNLLPPSPDNEQYKSKLLGNVFRECQRRNLVNGVVLKILGLVASKSLYDRLVVEDDAPEYVDNFHVDEEWRYTVS